MSEETVYTMRFARMSDYKKVYKIMQHMENEIDDTSIFVADDKAFVKSHIEKEGFIAVASFQNKIAAFLIVRFPEDSEDNLGLDLAFDEESLYRVNHMESVMVVEKHRGKLLQQKLIKFAEPIAKDMGYTIAMATVSPDNLYSLDNFLSLGYKEVLRKEKYDGVVRIILKKNL
jgi:ribosomal protein S18 acetylase RimI-like enzyme